MATLPPSVVIRGSGAYAPERVVTNDDLARVVDTSDAWIRTRTGIRERRFAAEGETTSDMAAAAGREALRDAGLGADAIDLLIVGTMTPDMMFPSTACLVQSELGMGPIAAFDLEAACSGFVYGVNVARAMLRGGGFKAALVIGAEKLSSILDFEDRSTCVLFGDGAGAAVLTCSDEPGVGVTGTVAGADGANPSLLYQPAGGAAIPASQDSVAARQHCLRMNGREIFKFAVRQMEDACVQVMGQRGLAPGDADCIIPHQANLRIIDSIASRLDIPAEKFFNNVQRYGNTSAASVPIALDEALRAGRIRAGDRVVLVAFGAGLTWGASLIEWT